MMPFLLDISPKLRRLMITRVFSHPTNPEFVVVISPTNNEKVIFTLPVVLPIKYFVAHPWYMALRCCGLWLRQTEMCYPSSFIVVLDTFCTYTGRKVLVVLWFFEERYFGADKAQTIETSVVCGSCMRSKKR